MSELSDLVDSWYVEPHQESPSTRPADTYSVCDSWAQPVELANLTFRAATQVVNAVKREAKLAVLIQTWRVERTLGGTYDIRDETGAPLFRTGLTYVQATEVLAALKRKVGAA